MLRLLCELCEMKSSCWRIYYFLLVGNVFVGMLIFVGAVVVGAIVDVGARVVLVTLAEFAIQGAVCAVTVDVEATVVVGAIVVVVSRTVDVGATVNPEATIVVEGTTVLREAGTVILPKDKDPRSLPGSAPFFTRAFESTQGADNAAFFVRVPESLPDEVPHEARSVTQSVADVNRITVDEIFMRTLFRKQSELNGEKHTNKHWLFPFPLISSSIYLCVASSLHQAMTELPQP